MALSTAAMEIAVAPSRFLDGENLDFP